MNLLILSWQYPPDACGGTENATRGLASALARSGHHVEIVSTGDWGRVQTDGCGRIVTRFVMRHRWRFLTYVALIFMALRVCRHTRIDVVHAQALWMGPVALAIRACHGIPYVLWGRGEDVRRPRLFGGPIRWLSLHYASAVLALNTAMALDLTRHGAQSVRVLGNGAGLTGLCALSKREARSRLVLPRSARVVVFVGSLLHSKGIDTLLRAFARAGATRHAAVLLVVGDGPLCETLHVSAWATCRDNSVVFTGLVAHEDVGVYLSAADVFALPSAAEGSPMAVAEAMAAGLPVVCCGVGALQDIIVPSVNGHVVRFGDEEGLANALADLLDNPRIAQQMGRRNLAWARQHSWDDVAERFAGICAEVTDRSAARKGASTGRVGAFGSDAL